MAQMNTGFNTPSLSFRCLLSRSYLCHLWLKMIGRIGPQMPQVGTDTKSRGGLGKMHELFGDRLDAVIEELNKELTA